MSSTLTTPDVADIYAEDNADPMSSDELGDAGVLLPNWDGGDRIASGGPWGVIAGSPDGSAVPDQVRDLSTEGGPEVRAALTPPPRLEKIRVSGDLSLLAKWQGVVEDVDVCLGRFTAKLCLLRGANEVDRELYAEFDLIDVDESDLPLLREGAIFYWDILLRTRPRVEKLSRIRFQRLGVWTQGAVERVEERARSWSEWFASAGSEPDGAPRL